MPLDLDHEEIVLRSVVAILGEATNTTVNVQQLTGILRPPITAGQTANGDMVFESSRSQIQIHIRQSRVEVRDFSESSIEDKPLIGHLRTLVNSLGGFITSIGLNLQMVIPLFDDGNSKELLVRSLLNRDWVESGFDGSVIGFGGTISYQLDDNSHWNLELRPRTEDPAEGGLFINLNHSIPLDPPVSTPLPDDWPGALEESRIDDLRKLNQWLQRFQDA